MLKNIERKQRAIEEKQKRVINNKKHMDDDLERLLDTKFVDSVLKNHNPSVDESKSRLIEY